MSDEIGKVTIDYDNGRVWLFDHDGFLIADREDVLLDSMSLKIDELPHLLGKFYLTVLRMRLEELIK